MHQGDKNGDWPCNYVSERRQRIAAICVTKIAIQILAHAQLFALSLCAVPASRGRAKPALLGRLALPAIGLLITPLFAKRLCAAPLAEALLRPGRVAPGCSGYLSMDQARSLLPIGADDDNVSARRRGRFLAGAMWLAVPLINCKAQLRSEWLAVSQ